MVADVNDLNDICTFQDGTAVICGSNGVIMRTTDFGVHWHQPLTFTQSNFSDLEKNDDGIVCVIADNYLIYCSSDKGLTWSEKYTSQKKLLTIFIDRDTFYCLSDVGNTLMWSINGREWQQYSFTVPDNAISVTVCKDTWFARLQVGYIYSNDKGKTWHKDTVENTPTFFPITYSTCLSKDTIGVIANNSLWLYSCDSKTWVNASDTSKSLVGVCSSPLSTLFVIDEHEGVKRVIRKTRKLQSEKMEKWTYPNMNQTCTKTIFFNKDKAITIGRKKFVWLSSNLDSGWVLRSALPTVIGSVAFLSDSIVVIGGGSGLVYRSIDGGTTFHPPFSKPNIIADVRSVHIVDSSHVYAITWDRSSLYLFSTDTGRTFQSITGPFNFGSQKAISKGNYMYRVMDLRGGDGIGSNLFMRYDIHKNAVDTLFPILKFPKAIGEFKVQNGSEIYVQILDLLDSPIKKSWLKSRNGGKSWDTLKYMTNEKAIYSLVPVENEQLIIALKNETDNNKYDIFNTNDNGETWNIIKKGTTICRFHFDAGSKTIYGTSEKGDSLIFSTSGGEKWEKILIKVGHNIQPKWDLAATGNMIWLNYNGWFCRSMPIEVISKVQEELLPSYVMPFWLEKPYPNPTRSILSIPFYCKKSVFPYGIQLKVFSPVGTLKEDLHQRVVSAKYDGTKATVECDVSEYSSGLYYVVITSGNHRMVMPFAVIK